MDDDGELYLPMDNFKPHPRRPSEHPTSGPPYPISGHAFPSPGPHFPPGSPQSFQSMISRPPPAPGRTNYSQVNLQSHTKPAGLPNSDPHPPPRPQYKPNMDDDTFPPHTMYRSPPNEPGPPPRPAKPPYMEELSQSHKPVPPIEDRRSFTLPNRRPPPVEPRCSADEELYLQIDEINESPPEVGMFQQQSRMNDTHDMHSGGHFQHYPPHKPRPSSFVSNDHLPERVIEQSPHPDPRSRSSHSIASPTSSSYPHPNRIPPPSPRRPSGNSYPLPNRDGNGSTKSQGSTSSGENVDVEVPRPRNPIDTPNHRPFQPITKKFIDNKFERPQPGNVNGSMVMPPVAFPRQSMNSSVGTSIMPPLNPITSNARTNSTTEASAASDSSNHIASQNKSKNVDDQTWYRNVDRKKAEGAIRQELKDGCFIVRPGKGLDTPYSLTVCNDSQISNLQIRRRDDGNFAFGREKENERSFPNVVDLITYHMDSALVLADKKGSVILYGPP